MARRDWSLWGQVTTDGTGHGPPEYFCLLDAASSSSTSAEGAACVLLFSALLRLSVRFLSVLLLILLSCLVLSCLVFGKEVDGWDGQDAWCRASASAIASASVGRVR